MMRSKTQSPVNTKLIILSFFFLLFLSLVTWSSFSSSKLSSSSNKQNTIADRSTLQKQSTSTYNQEDDPEKSSSSFSAAEEAEELVEKLPECPTLPPASSCTKSPPSLANALVHYVTTNITPQQTFKEISVTLRVLEKKSPCNFLIFGLGHDSLMWASLNHGGRTVFLEEDEKWIEEIRGQQPSLESYHVTYDTKVHQANGLMKTGVADDDCRVVSDPRSSKCTLSLRGFPPEVYNIEWDLIMVDAPTGYHVEAPGRMTAIFTAGLIGRNRDSGETDVFVHDVDRAVEDKFSMAFLCEGYMAEQEGRLRHFVIPSHKTSARPFCPN